MLARLWQRARPRRRHRGCTINSIGDPDERRAHRADARRLLRRSTRRCSTTTRSAGCTPIRCASSTPRIRRMQELIARRAEARRSPRRRVARALRRPAAAARATRHPVRDRRAAGARARLLQSHGVRVGHRPARRAGHGRRRRALRRPVRAAGRQADAGLRLRDRHRADDPAAAGGGRDRARDAPLAYVVHDGEAARRGSRARAARCCATPATRSSSTPAAAASSRR